MSSNKNERFIYMLFLLRSNYITAYETTVLIPPVVS